MPRTLFIFPGGAEVAGAEQRKEERVRAALRVQLPDNGVGITRDVSASGIFFETLASYAAQSPISLTIEIARPAGPMLLSCQAEIVRIERRDVGLGIAVRFLDTSLNAQAELQ